jgi:hypothetical protein
MKILLINNDGGGFADYVDVAEGTNVSHLFSQQMGSVKPANYLIRVNRQPVPPEQVLHEGDRVSITPIKIEGALIDRRWRRRERSTSVDRSRQPNGDLRWRIHHRVSCCGWPRKYRHDSGPGAPGVLGLVDPAGKRIGSRKGFHAGRCRRRRR